MIDFNTYYRLKSYVWGHSPQIYGGLWDYYTNIHPKTETQFRAQKFLAGGIPFYGAWMQSRSQDERNYNTSELYGIKFSDIKYPWLSGLTSANESQVLGSATWQFSKNISRLYR